MTPRALTAYLGLVPTERWSGGQTARGGITKTGNGLLRRVTERPGTISIGPARAPGCSSARAGQPPRIIAIADKAKQRLCRRFRRLAEHHKPAPKIAVAIARELAGFIWAALQPVPAAAK